MAAAGPSLAADFDDFKPGAKAMGMGMAYSAVADDPYAMFFNPAGTANTPYSQAGFSVGRLDSPIGTMSSAALTYLRPFEQINTATVGTAYYTDRQFRGGDKDEFLFHYSQEIKVPQLMLSRPLKVGANLKFLSVTDDRGGGGSSLFGLGGDVAALARGNSGLSGSFVVQDLITNIGTPRPKLSMGLAYTWQKWLTLAGDMRVRDGLTDFYPGIEGAFYQGLLKLRAGRGFQLDGVSQFAWGFGVNFSPVIIDAAMTIPTNGIHRHGGAYQMSFNYRFGAPSFSGNFVGAAADRAEALKASIEQLEERRKTLDSQAQTSETHRQITEAELDTLGKRYRELEDEYRGLQRKKDQVEFELREDQVLQQGKAAPKPPPPMIRPVPPPPAKIKKPAWPARHVVKPGETLRSMAKDLYGDGNLWETIYEANKEKVERGLPQEGAEFVIPPPPPH